MRIASDYLNAGLSESNSKFFSILSAMFSAAFKLSGAKNEIISVNYSSAMIKRILIDLILFTYRCSNFGHYFF